MKRLLTLTLFLGLAFGQDWLTDLKQKKMDEWLLKPKNSSFVKDLNNNKFFSEKMRGDVNLAIWNFYGNNELYSQLQNKLVEYNHNVIDRSVLELTIKEKNLSMSGIVVGKSDIFSVLNIDYVISGNADAGIFKLIDVETGLIESSVNLSKYGPRKDNFIPYTSFIISGLVSDMSLETKSIFYEYVDRWLMNNDDYNSANNKIRESNFRNRRIESFGETVLGCCIFFALLFLIPD